MPRRLSSNFLIKFFLIRCIAYCRFRLNAVFFNRVSRSTKPNSHVLRLCLRIHPSTKNRNRLRDVPKVHERQILSSSGSLPARCGSVFYHPTTLLTTNLSVYIQKKKNALAFFLRAQSRLSFQATNFRRVKTDSFILSVP